MIEFSLNLVCFFEMEKVKFDHTWHEYSISPITLTIGFGSRTSRTFENWSILLVFTRLYGLFYQTLWLVLPDSMTCFTRLYDLFYQTLWLVLPHSMTCFTRLYDLFYQTLWLVLPDSTTCFTRLYDLFYQTLQLVLPDSTTCFTRLYDLQDL